MLANFNHQQVSVILVVLVSPRMGFRFGSLGHFALLAPLGGGGDEQSSWSTKIAGPPLRLHSLAQLLVDCDNDMEETSQK